MPISTRQRHSFSSTMGIGSLVGAMIFAVPLPSGHAATDVFARVRESGSIVSGEKIVRVVHS
jgi:hypothetical protein